MMTNDVCGNNHYFSNYVVLFLHSQHNNTFRDLLPYPIKKIAVLHSENRRKPLLRVVKSQYNRRL